MAGRDSPPWKRHGPIWLSSRNQCTGWTGSQRERDMPKKNVRAKAHVLHHRDGSVWARGQTIDGVPSGYWEWFRKDGTRMRSGSFTNGMQTGEWTTYDRTGAVYKVTAIKPRAR